MTSNPILVVDDEPAIADTLEYALQQEGFPVLRCLLGQEAISTIKQHPNIACVVLDVGLPDLSGFEVCKQLREISSVPIIFLTARSDELDRIVGLEIGADDYVVKPFSPREVATRVKVILRRIANEKTLEAQASPDALNIDLERASVFFSGQSVELTKYEFQILALLTSSPERVYSRQQIMENIWPDAVASLERSVDTHIKTLRSKLREIDSSIDVIKTHRGLGYSANRL